jgi:hypothetical protein
MRFFDIFKDKHDDKYYEFEVYCTNCEYVDILKILRGIPVDKKFLKQKSCRTCGCDTLVRNSLENRHESYY